MTDWRDDERALAYLGRADDIPHRAEGEAVLLAEVPRDAPRVLDLGSGDGRLLDLVLLARPGARGVALDYSARMLERLEQRFGANEYVQIVEHDLADPLPPLGTFDAVVSSFAIHHLPHERKRRLYQEIWALLNPGGVFCNLEHVASPTARVHQRFLEAMDRAEEEEDPANKLLDVETQLQWLREIGFSDVDCFWKWREFAVLAGSRPEPAAARP
jgi:tRNA (cmo5U34)-methyltransferase